MKPFITPYPVFFIVVLSAFFSCSKNALQNTKNLNNTGICIQQMQVLPGDLPVNAPPIINIDPITQQQIDTIKALFTKNSLPANQYQFVYYSNWSASIDSTQTQVTVNPFINGLPVFLDQQVFNFDNGVFNASGSYLTTEVAPSTDTAGHQSLTNLRNVFLQHVSESTIIWPLLNSQPTVPSPAAYADTCLWASLGYIDQSFVPGGPNAAGHLIKVWHVTPANSNYPTVLVRDDNGQGWGWAIDVP